MKSSCIDSWYEFDVALFQKDLLIESNMNIYIKDRKSLETKSFLELNDSYQYDANRAYELKDGSFLCGMSNKYNNILRQYVNNNNNIIEINKISFAGYKDNFVFIYQTSLIFGLKYFKLLLIMRISAVSCCLNLWAASASLSRAVTPHILRLQHDNV